MPQAALPDINTSFIKWRNKITFELECEHYTAVLGSLNNFNACLDEKFTVQISTEQYNEKIAAEKLMCVCAKCRKEQNYKEVKKATKRNLPFIELITKRKHEEIWICQGCAFENLLKNTDFIQAKLPNPYYFQVVPDPPKRSSFLDKKEFHKKFEAWTWTFFGELEHAAQMYRVAHWNKNQGMETIQISEEDEKDE